MIALTKELQVSKKISASEWIREKLLDTNFNNVEIYKLYDQFIKETLSSSSESSFQGSIRKLNRKLKKKLNVNDTIKTFPADWIKKNLLKYQDGAVVKEMYNLYIKETGASTSKTGYYGKVDKLNGKLKKTVAKAFDKSKYTEEYLFDLLEQETEVQKRKLVFTDLKRIADEHKFESGIFYQVLPTLQEDLDHIYKLAMHHIGDKKKEVKLQNEVKLLKAENKELVANAVTYDNAKDIFNTVVKEYAPLELDAEFVKPKKKGAKKREVVLYISDIHWGDKVSKKEINGINEYDISIAKERIDSYFAQVKEMITEWGITDATIVLNGDIVEGYIQPDSVRNADIHAVSGVLTVADYLSAHIAETRKYLKKINIYAMVGNHGRMLYAGKPNQKNYVEFSLDALVYNFMKKELKGVVEKFVIPDSIFYVVPVLDRHMLVTHGHTCKGGGNGYQPIPNSISKNITKMIGLVAQSVFEHIKKEHYKVDFALIGHFHIPTETYTFDMTPVYVNGSPKGADEFSVQALGKASPPAQRLFYLEEGYGNHGVKYAPIIYL